jgi:hypothetical protein
MSLSEWLQSANQYAKKGYSKSQVIEQLGKPPGRITSNGNGGFKKRTGNKQGQAAKRRQFDTPSTDLARTEAKQLESTKQKINGEASLYGLEPTQIEHIADQDDAKSMTAGAPGDPNNKLIVKESEARFKDKVKQLVGKDYSVVNNSSEESLKVIENKYFDPIADPSTLPGTDIRNSSELRKFLDFIENSNGRIADSAKGISPRARIKALAIASAVPGFLGTAADAAETTARVDVARKSGNPVDWIQAGISGITTATGATGVGEVVGLPLELLNGSIDQHREGLPQIRGRNGAARASK